MVFCGINFYNFNRFGICAQPMPMRPFGFAHYPYSSFGAYHHHHHCCSNNSFGNFLTTMLLGNILFKNSSFNITGSNTQARTQHSYVSAMPIVPSFNVQNWFNPFVNSAPTGLNLNLTNPTEAMPVSSFSETVPFRLSIPKKTVSQSAIVSNVARNYNVGKPNTITSNEEIAKVYDPEKGEKIAQAAIEGLQTAQNGYCARAVKTAISNSGLGAYESGHAKDMPEILSRNKNFKEVKVTNANDIPAGSILCYPPGDCSASAEYGHTSIKVNKTQAVHFTVTNNVRLSDRTRVFIPV